MTHIVEIQISHALSLADWDTLEAFCSKAERLIQTKIVSADQSEIQSRVHFCQGEGASFEAQLPPEEQVAEFLLAFRFFYLESELTNFHKVLGVLGRHTNAAEARAALKAYKNQWTNALFQSAMNLQLNGEPVTASLLLDIWFNAHYFHSDRKKSDKLAKLNSAFTEPFSKYMLLDSTYNATKVVFLLYNGVKDLVAARRKSRK